jgi:hypothetical protein
LAIRSSAARATAATCLLQEGLLRIDPRRANALEEEPLPANRLVANPDWSALGGTGVELQRELDLAGRRALERLELAELAAARLASFQRASRARLHRNSGAPRGAMNVL